MTICLQREDGRLTHGGAYITTVLSCGALSRSYRRKMAWCGVSCRCCAMPSASSAGFAIDRTKRRPVMLTIEEIRAAYERSEPILFEDPAWAPRKLPFKEVFYPFGFPLEVE